MNEHKSLLTKLSETIDRHRAEQRERRAEQPVAIKQPGRLSRLVRWLLPNGGTLIVIALLIAAQSVWARTLQEPAAPGPSATTVNYQGRLANSGGNPLNGNYAMTFAIYSAATSGNLIWGPETHAAIPVSNGLFSVGLGSQTSGGIPTNVWNGDRYLEISVSGETLSPRELIRSVPIAGMALTVPDGAVVSDKMNLDHGTACLSGNTQLNMPGNWQPVDVPSLNLNFSLTRPSQVLVWIDGLAGFTQSARGEIDVLVYVDGIARTSSFGYDTIDVIWFSLKGQRLINLAGGSHSISVKVNSGNPGTAIIHGVGFYQTCINYLVLGEQ